MGVILTTYVRPGMLHQHICNPKRLMGLELFQDTKEPFRLGRFLSGQKPAELLRDAAIQLVVNWWWFRLVVWGPSNRVPLSSNPFHVRESQESKPPGPKPPIKVTLRTSGASYGRV